jgi:hypothetical protein
MIVMNYLLQTTKQNMNTNWNKSVVCTLVTALSKLVRAGFFVHGKGRAALPVSGKFSLSVAQSDNE